MSTLSVRRVTQQSTGASRIRIWYIWGEAYATGASTQQVLMLLQCIHMTYGTLGPVLSRSSDRDLPLRLGSDT